MVAELSILPDRNKTDLTHDVTASVMRYLDEQGFKPVETEVPVADGWIADLAGVIVPTQTEAVNMKLIPRKPQYDYNRWRDAEYRARREAMTAECEARFNALPCPITALVEVKTSRADFSKDKKWTMPAPTNLCYLAVPAGMLKPSEYPEGWTVLSVSEGGDVQTVQRGILHSVPVERQLQTVLAIAVRRDHQTRYARLREFEKAQRCERAERVSLMRFAYAVRAIAKIVRGKGESVDDVLRSHAIKGLTRSDTEELMKLWNVAPSLE
jgi:hypothetical protein